MRTILSITLLLASTLTFSQTWQWSKQIGGPCLDEASILLVDSSENIYLTGNYGIYMGWDCEGCYFDEDTLTGSHDAFFAKYSSSGELLWLRDLPCAGWFGIGSVVLDPENAALYMLATVNGDCLLDTVSVTAQSAVSVVLAKWNLDGHCLWARTIASSGLVLDLYCVVGTSLVLDAAGELMVGIRTSAYGPSQVESALLPTGAYIGKYDSDGQPLWWKPFALYSGTQKSTYLDVLKRHGDRIYGYGPVVLPEGVADTTAVDTIQIIGRQGRGFALASIDPATGVSEWFRMDGFPKGAAGAERMSVDGQGNIVVVGSYSHSMAVFGDDTLSSAVSYSKGFIAKYATGGSLLYVREFVGSDLFGYTGMDLAPDGTMALTGSFRGQISLGGSSFTSSTNKDLFVAVHDSTGEPQAFMHTGVGSGERTRFLGDDLVVCGVFPSTTTPFGSIAIGGENYTSHGYGDIILARGSLPTNIAFKASTDERLMIYANPNQGSFRIVMPEGLRYASNLMLRVYDAAGRQLHQQKLDIGNERPKVDLFSASPGFYMVTIGNGQQSYSGNLVVE